MIILTKFYPLSKFLQKNDPYAEKIQLLTNFNRHTKQPFSVLSTQLALEIFIETNL